MIRHLLISLLAAAGQLTAQEFTVFEAFTDHAVLQRGASHPIHGWGQAGRSVTIRLDDQTVDTKCDREGKWTARLPPMPAGGPHTLMLTQGSSEIALSDLYFGDVYLLSGQSNMNYRMISPKRLADTIRTDEIADPLIRHIDVARSSADMPLDHLELNQPWTPGTPTALRNFSAVGSYFAHYLREAGVEVPIGLLHSSWGGSRIEAWLRDGVVEAGAEERPPNKTPVVLYNAMIAPLADWPLTGILWYQGEANSRPGDVEHYDQQMRQLILSWREHFGAPDLPFYWVQLPNFQPDWETPDGHGWEVIRAKQSAALDVPRTGQAIAIDIGQADDIHPPNKWEVGRRLSLLALKDIYGREVHARSPAVSGLRIDDGVAEVTFDSVGDGLEVRIEPQDRYSLVKSVEVLGQDDQWRWAIATLNPQISVLRVINPAGTGIQRVRYAWGSNPEDANLYTVGGLPVTPFDISRK